MYVKSNVHVCYSGSSPPLLVRLPSQEEGLMPQSSKYVDSALKDIPAIARFIRISHVSGVEVNPLGQVGEQLVVT